MEKAFLLIFTDCLTDGTLVHDLTEWSRTWTWTSQIPWYSFGHFRTRRMRCKREVESDLAMWQSWKIILWIKWSHLRCWRSVGGNTFILDFKSSHYRTYFRSFCPFKSIRILKSRFLEVVLAGSFDSFDPTDIRLNRSVTSLVLLPVELNLEKYKWSDLNLDNG